MKIQHLRSVSAAFITTALLAGGPVLVNADPLADVHKINKARTANAVKSQERVDKLNQERQDLLNDYKATNKEIDGLRVYNKQLEKQLTGQKRKLGELEASIAQATAMKRQITPLMLRMLDGLEQFVALDVPFLKEERDERIQFIKDAMDQPNVSDAEKFRQVLDGYQVEGEYGRKIESYTAIIPIEGIGDEVNVNILRIGRIALLAQTTDERTTLAWDNKARQWVKLDESYRNSVRQGIRIARKQTTIDIMTIPVAAPENAQ